MITKVYTAKVTIDRDEYEDNRVFPEKLLRLLIMIRRLNGLKIKKHTTKRH